MSGWLLLAASLFSAFESPPDAARPWCYWYWVNGNVDRETITADLEAMRSVGFGGVLLLDPRGYDTKVAQPPVRYAFGSPEWRKMVVHGARECERLGLEFTMNLSDCGGSLRGPWPTGSDAPKQLVVGVDDDEVPSSYEGYREILSTNVQVAADARIVRGWRNAGGSVSRWGGGRERETIPLAKSGERGRQVRLRFGFCTIPGRTNDVDVIDAAAVERHFRRMTDDLFAEMGDLVGKTFSHVYSVSWEGAIPTWTGNFREEFRRRTGYDVVEWLPVLAGFGGGESVWNDFRRVRNALFRDAFYGTVRRLAHARGLRLYSESGGPWNRSPDVFREADQLEFLGVNDMPQGEFWTVAPSHHADLAHNRAAANAAHIYGLRRASAEAFTHMDLHYSMYPALLKRSADDAFVDGINHLVWHTFTCSPKAFGRPGLEYFAGTHINRNVTWFGEAGPFLRYLARCQYLLQSGENVADIAIVGTGTRGYRHWGRYRRRPYENAAFEIPPGYNYDILNDACAERAGRYAAVVDAAADQVRLPALPPPDAEGVVSDFIHRRLPDGTDIYFVTSVRPCRGKGVFRVKGGDPQVWDAVTGRRTVPPYEATADGRTAVELDLPRNGSAFVIFGADAAVETPRQDPFRVCAVPGPWQVDIGGRPHDALGDWTASGDPEIRYFSGTANYGTSFDIGDIPDAGSRIAEIDLGEVLGGLAHVCVNGFDCGIAWCPPWTIRVPRGVLRAGRNDLSVEVTNTWRNRLIGDCAADASNRRTESNLRYETKPGREKGWKTHSTGPAVDDPLEPSGLVGPIAVRLAFDERTTRARVGK